MTTPGIRRFLLTVHVTSSVGWIGAVCVFLALAVIGLRSESESTVRGVYLVMDRAAWLTLVPFAFASFVTGVVMSLVTRGVCSSITGWYSSCSSQSSPPLSC